MDFKLGVVLSNYGLPTEEALDKAAGLGLDGVQLSRTRDEYAPQNMTPEKLRALRASVEDRGMVFSAVCGEQMNGLADREQNVRLVENLKRIVDMALALGTNIVTSHIGVIPDDATQERYKIMQDACFAVADYAHSVGARFAIETGPEIATVLRDFLDSLKTPGIAVNLDPGNLVMVTGDDPVKAVHTLKDYIIHTHAKDGKLLRRGDVNHLYATAQAEQYHGEYLIEKPLGRGDVGYPAYLHALDSIGYHGYLAIERECDGSRAEDIAYGAGYLRGLIGR